MEKKYGQGRQSHPLDVEWIDNERAENASTNKEVGIDKQYVGHKENWYHYILLQACCNCSIHVLVCRYTGHLHLIATVYYTLTNCYIFFY